MMELRRRELAKVGLVIGAAVTGPAKARAKLQVTTTPFEIKVHAYGATNYAAVFKVLREYCEREILIQGMPGMIVALADDDGFRATMALGWADREVLRRTDDEQLFQIGSISKSVAALALFRLAEAGRIDLDSRVADALPDIPWPDTPFTLRNLLNHSSGLPHEASYFPRVRGGRLWLGFSPGSTYYYSNLGFHLLGLIIERASGKPYAKAVQELVFEPLGMRESRAAIISEDKHLFAQGYEPEVLSRTFAIGDSLAPASWYSQIAAAGSCAANGKDMTRYVRYLISVGRSGAPLLSAQSAKTFCKPTIEIPGSREGQKHYYANGLEIIPLDGQLHLHHTGGMKAFSSAITVDPHDGIGCVVSVNAGSWVYRPTRVSALACQLMRAARNGAGLPTAPNVPLDTVVPDASDFEGSYLDADSATLELRADGQALSLSAAGRNYVLHRTFGDRFEARGEYPTIYPLLFRRQSGKISGVAWGSTNYARNAPAPAAVDGTLQPMVGRYDSGDSIVLFVQREGVLYLFGIEAMARLPDGSFRSAKNDRSPERYSFDGFVNGRPMRLTVSGTDFWRVE